MLWIIIVILLVLWVIGLTAEVGGGMLHFLPVFVAVVLIIRLLTGRRIK
jgi:hypothetical protein